MNDKELDDLLRAGSQKMELPASFQREVWQRIASDTARQSSRPSVWTWLLEWLARPLPAAAAWALALFAGILIGGLKSQATAPSSHAEAYAQLINPLAKMPTP